MGALADRLDRMRLTVTAAGGQVRAELAGRTTVTVSFAPGFYQRVTEPDLEYALTALARLLWVERTRAARAAVEELLEPPTSQQGPARTAREKAFEDAREHLRVEGCSPDRHVVIATDGLRTWQVHLAPDTLRTLDENEFRTAVQQAATDLIGAIQQRMVVIKAQLPD